MSLQEYYFVLTALFLAGFIGWSLFAYMLIKTVYIRRKEIAVIEEIFTELEKVKQEIKELK
jgi:hypothetical protein